LHVLLQLVEEVADLVALAQDLGLYLGKLLANQAGLLLREDALEVEHGSQPADDQLPNLLLQSLVILLTQLQAWREEENILLHKEHCAARPGLLDND